MEGQRLDRWLWCARLVKTRSLAARLIEDGKVRVSGERALKVSRNVRLGDVVTGTMPEGWTGHAQLREDAFRWKSLALYWVRNWDRPKFGARRPE
jgi:ribosomal protein S4